MSSLLHEVDNGRLYRADMRRSDRRLKPRAGLVNGQRKYGTIVQRTRRIGFA